MASAKHFINDPTKLVSQALRAAPILNPTCALDEVNKVVYRKHYDENSRKKVSILSGGGRMESLLYVGAGMLDAVVCGTIFASPNPTQIFNALRDLDRRAKSRGVDDHSVLVILMNYTGDVMSFGLAVEKANAAGIKVDMVIVGDDVSVGRTKGGKVGRRGIGGTVYVHKVAGALAEEGCSHGEVKSAAEAVEKNIVSIGASLEHVHVPGHDVSDERLGENEIEIGMGIHNEQGFKTITASSLTEVVDILLDQLLNEKDTDRGYLGEIKKEDEYVLMVNNLGGVSQLEMGGITTTVAEQLQNKHLIHPKRVYCGTLMTSLNGNGFSISILRLPKIPKGDILTLLDAKTTTLVSLSPLEYKVWDQCGKEDEEMKKAKIAQTYKRSGLTMNVNLFLDVVELALRKLMSAEKEITKYDELVGDGDCGIGLCRGAESIMQLLESGEVCDDVAITIQKVAEGIERSMDGTSGAIYCIFFNALSLALRRGADEKVERAATALDWAQAALSAQQSLSKYTPAMPGDRTLVDALHPFIKSLNDTNGNLKLASEAARAGADSTRGMKASLGRTVYVGSIGDVPDPGAIGIAELVEGLHLGVQNYQPN
ncbi:dihydroxyacetone kinase [Peziza echinospora]|nr:dihydroxyacetone kinase [Peziza echinospora]